MTTYIYVRVSTLEQAQDERTSLETQRMTAQGSAMMRGIPPENTVVVCDIGVSGGLKLSARPEGGKMYAKLVTGDLIISSKLDRLFRSVSDASTTAETLMARGIHIILSDLGPEPVTSNGQSKLFFNMLTAFAEFEKTRIAERMAEGRKGKKARGGYACGAVPYGFDVVGQGREAMLVKNEREQAMVSRAITLRAGGLTLRRVADELSDEGYLSRSGKVFLPEQVKQILRAGGGL